METAMLGMKITVQNPTVSRTKRVAAGLIQIMTYRWIEIDSRCLEDHRLEETSCFAVSAAGLLAHRNRHHTALDDNPSSG
jgi:hypothetical protein